MARTARRTRRKCSKSPTHWWNERYVLVYWGSIYKSSIIVKDSSKRRINPSLKQNTFYVIILTYSFLINLLFLQLLISSSFSSIQSNCDEITKHCIMSLIKLFCDVAILRVGGKGLSGMEKDFSDMKNCPSRGWWEPDCDFTGNNRWQVVGCGMPSKSKADYFPIPTKARHIFFEFLEDLKKCTFMHTMFWSVCKISKFLVVFCMI